MHEHQLAKTSASAAPRGPPVALQPRYSRSTVPQAHEGTPVDGTQHLHLIFIRSPWPAPRRTSDHTRKRKRGRVRESKGENADDDAFRPPTHPGGAAGAGPLRFGADRPWRQTPGAVDPTFDPGHVEFGFGSAWVQKVLGQPDGKILIGGAFSTVQGVSRNSLARLNPDGTLDTTFVPPFVVAATIPFVSNIVRLSGRRHAGRGQRHERGGRTRPLLDRAPEPGRVPGSRRSRSREWRSVVAWRAWRCCRTDAS